MLRTSLVGGLVFASALAAQAKDNVVLAAFAADDPFDAAAQVLAAHHRAEIVRFDPADLEPVRAALVAATPRHVALVMRPEQLDFPFVRRFLQLATEVDGDPFVDFAFGYITGRTAGDAVALAKRGVARKPKPLAGKVAMVAGGSEKSFVLERPHALRDEQLPALQIYSAGEKAFPEAGRDRAFLQKHLGKLADCDTVTFAGHGYPREVVGGPTFADLAGLDLTDAVVLNVACYTGVTQRWFEDDWKAGVVRGREVPLDESFGLAVLRAGAVGYTAYVCPRPAGPELDTDLAALIADGASLGDARRRDYDKTVLGFLGFGAERLQLAPVADGDKIAPNRDAVRDMMLEGATGGVLFGDPACVPFERRDDQSPVAIEIEPQESALRVRAKTSLTGLYLQCADPTAKWGETMAMRVHARVPLGERLVEDVVVDELKIGRAAQPSRVLWAVEDDHGERFLQLKVNFPRGERMTGALTMAARIVTTADPAKARQRGGEVQRPAVSTKDVRSRTIEPFLLERATAREVSHEALQAALDASARLLGDQEVDEQAMERFAAFGSEGFRAVCAMLEVGHAHHLTSKLLAVSWRPGDERHLLALASGPALPNFASWSVVRGLAVADTPEVRAWLTTRLAAEQDAGLFMSIAQAMAQLGRRDAAAAIGDRVLEFRDRWGGVEPHLISALGQLGGADAVDRLERIAVDERTESWKAALAALDRLDAEAAKRVRAARGIDR